MNSLGALEWRGLNEILTKSYLQRKMSDRVIACELYTNHQVIENDTADERMFVVTKAHSDDVPIEHVCINDEPTDFQIAGGCVQFAVLLPARASANVDILYRNPLSCGEAQRSFRKASRVWTRRMLSEFRDSVLCRSNFLLAKAQAVNRGIRRQPATTSRNA
jgi:hypothetical protein